MIIEPSIHLVFTVCTNDDLYVESIDLEKMSLRVDDKVIELKPLILKLLDLIGREDSK